MRGVENEEALMEEFGKKINAPVLANIPRDPIVQEAEAKKGTVLQYFPESNLAKKLIDLAEKILENPIRVVPTPIDLPDIMELLRKYQALG
jgi:nitrogenase iron protein NifH